MDHEQLHIAEIAPPYFQVPPEGYGGIETVVAMLVDGLVDRGHKVTLIGAGDDETQANFLATYDEPQTQRVGDSMIELTHAARVDNYLEDLDVDIVHDHSAPGGAAARGKDVPVVVTSHGPAGEWGEYLREVDHQAALVAISQSQRRLCSELAWHAVIHNALDTSEIPITEHKQEHLVWMGRMSPDKGAHLAIDVSQAAGRPIILAAKCTEPDEQAYFEEFIEPRLGPEVVWRHEVGPPEKFELLGEAAAFVFPLQWEEPFGMVVLEAMACGTPVLSLNRGAIPELVVDGTTGFLRSEAGDLVEAIERVHEIDPVACRQRVDENFSPELMVSRYERVFREVHQRGAKPALSHN